MEGLQRGSLNEPPGGEKTEAGVAGAHTAAPEDDLWARFAEAPSPEAFCSSWLALQCRMIRGVSAGVVVLGGSENGRFAPAAFWPDRQRDLQHLAQAAERAITERHGLVIRQPVSAERDSPSHHGCHVAYPIQLEGRVRGVVALDLVPRPDSQLQFVLRQLQWGSAWLELLFRRQEAPDDPAARERLWMVLELVAVAVGHERFYGAATAFVTELATRLSCGRVSLGLVQHGRCQVRAVSHSARFSRQTNLIRAVETAMDEALDQQCVILHPEPPGSAPQVTNAHAGLARQHGLASICSVPLRSGDRLFGVLTLERAQESPFDLRTVELCEAIAEVAGPVLEIQERDERFILIKAWEALRAWLSRLTGPHHVGLKLAAGGLGLALLFCALARGDYRVSAKTVMEPAVQRAAVAPFNGYIADARVRAGDLVRKNDLLCALDDRDLRLERLRWLSQHEQLSKQYQQAMAKREAAQVRILAAQIEQARAQLSLLDDQLSRTRIQAPFDGVVVSGDLSQALGAPVERGQMLFEVAPLEAYRIVLEVDERDIDEVAPGQRGKLLLTGFPTEPLPFTVQKITPVSTAREGRNYFRVEARLDEPSNRLRPGMEGVGKIDADRRHLIWIWTHQTTDWLRLALWRWLP